MSDTDVKCVGSGAGGCGFAGGVSGEVCPQCGGMLLSSEARQSANTLASSWENQKKPVPVQDDKPHALFELYCKDTAAGDWHRPFENYCAGYLAAQAHHAKGVELLADTVVRTRTYKC